MTHLVCEKIPLFILAAISSLVTFIVQEMGGAMGHVKDLSLYFRIANALVSYTSYIGKMIYPSGLAVLYPHPGSDLPAWQPIVCFTILAVLTMCIIYAAKRRRYLAVG